MTAAPTLFGVDGRVSLAAEGDAPSFHVVEGVEIAHVGMDWPSANGPVTLTMQHLADAVMAAGQDPHVLIPRLKIGHTDPRFNEDPPQHDPFAYHGPLREDGNPVYGRVANLRLAEDGMVLVGDYVEVPGWLFNALPSAYPSRSLEGDFDVETEGGKKYSFVITAVSLLGEPLPAITCLDDLVRELTGGPDAVLEQTPVTLSKEETSMPQIALEASTDALRAQFFDEFAQGERYWWWPCEIRVDEAWILADDDEGHLYRVPVTIDDNGAATFGDPVAGVLDFREIPDPEAAEPVAASRGVRFSTAQAAGRPKDRVRTAAANTTEGAHMADETETNVSTQLLERLGLPEDATEEQIQEAAIAKLDELEAAPPVAEPIAASKGEVVDPDALAALQAAAARGVAADEKLLAAERAQIVDERIRLGAITPASRDHHLAELGRGGEIEKTHRAYLASLKTGVIPVTEKGVNPSDAATEAAEMSTIMASFGVRTPPAGREQ